MSVDTDTTTGERADLLAALAKQRRFLRFTTRGITDEQARQRTTVSELTLGGVIKHVAAGERNWTRFIVEGPEAIGDVETPDDDVLARWAEGFRLQPGETLTGVLDEYTEVARQTEELIARLPDLDAAQPLPKAPWFEAGAHWSARRVLLHVVAETAQHAGHADIIREALDGAQTMA
jgi:hypothetical protein